jgi:hypothetical protein
MNKEGAKGDDGFVATSATDGCFYPCQPNIDKQ